MLKAALSVFALALVQVACVPADPDAATRAKAAAPPEGWFDVALGKPQRTEKQGQATLADLRRSFSILASEPALSVVPGAGSRPEVRVTHVTEARAHEICNELRQRHFTACKILPRVD